MSTATRSASAERFAARTRRRRRRLIITVSSFLLVAAAVVGGSWLVGWSSVLSVQNVSVTGVGDEVAEQVADVAEAPVGVPLARVDTGAIADRVRQVPEVGDAQIRRSWPQTLTIDVEPRTAVAAVPDGQHWWQVDESGVLFSRTKTAPDGLPELAAPTDESAALARSTGVAVLIGLPAAVDELVDSVEVESVADVRLFLDDGATVHWGTAERPEDKARALLALMERVEEPPSAYDVSAPDKPAIVP